MSTSTPTPSGATQAAVRRPRWRGWLIALIAAVIVVALDAVGIFAWVNSQQSCSKAADPSRPGAVTEYCPSDPYNPSGVVTFGPDGNIWYTDTQGKVARFTPQSGAITETAVPTPGNAIGYAGLVRGVDGNIWYIANDKLGRISMSGEFKEFDLPKELGLTRGIAAGTKRILEQDTLGGHVKITVPRDGTGTPQIAEAPLPANATVGPMVGGLDGNLWMATGKTVVSRITPAGAITQFSLHIPGPDPTGCGEDCKAVTGLTAGPDGNVWFSTDDGNITRITPAGVVTKFSQPHTRSTPHNITAGPDGGVWFMLGGYSQALQLSPRFARITP